MANNKPIKIKTLPRSNEAPPPKAKVSPASESKDRDPATVIGLAFFALAVGLVVLSLHLSNTQTAGQKQLASVNPEKVLNDKINTYLQETARRREIEKMDLELEKDKVKSEFAPGAPQAYAPVPNPSSKPLGVYLDQEDPASEVYKDLYGRNSGAGRPILPEDRINMRIEQRKWINQLQISERKQFIKNFLARARAAGYDLELNDDLVVVKVKRLTNHPRIPLDKVLERLNQQGL